MATEKEEEVDEEEEEYLEEGEGPGGERDQQGGGDRGGQGEQGDPAGAQTEEGGDFQRTRPLLTPAMYVLSNTHVCYSR